MVSKACYELKGQRRWALSGTPIVNRLDDLYSLLWVKNLSPLEKRNRSIADTILSHFLRLEPWGHYSFFRSFVTIPFLAQDPKALNVVQYILESCLLRREKTMRDKDGKLIVDLPPKTVSCIPVSSFWGWDIGNSLDSGRATGATILETWAAHIQTSRRSSKEKIHSDGRRRESHVELY